MKGLGSGSVCACPKSARRNVEMTRKVFFGDKIILWGGGALN